MDLRLHVEALVASCQLRAWLIHCQCSLTMPACKFLNSMLLISGKLEG